VESWKWKFQQPGFWLGLIWAICTELVAVGLVRPGTVAARVVAGVVGLLGLYGVNSAVEARPPRKPLIEMSPDERDAIFTQYPHVRDRFYTEHPELAPAGWHSAPAPPPPIRPG
jgi:uncharacterized membrane protein